LFLLGLFIFNASVLLHVLPVMLRFFVGHFLVNMGTILIYVSISTASRHAL